MKVHCLFKLPLFLQCTFLSASIPSRVSLYFSGPALGSWLFQFLRKVTEVRAGLKQTGPLFRRTFLSCDLSDTLFSKSSSDHRLSGKTRDRFRFITPYQEYILLGGNLPLLMLTWIIWLQ